MEIDVVDAPVEYIERFDFEDDDEDELDIPRPVKPPTQRIPIPLDVEIPQDILDRISHMKFNNVAWNSGNATSPHTTPNGGSPKSNKRKDNKFLRTATSKIHLFRPAATLQEALQFLHEHKAHEATLVLEDFSSLKFSDGKFDCYEDEE